jgi:hypothetical protein
VVARLELAGYLQEAAEAAATTDTTGTTT